MEEISRNRVSARKILKMDIGIGKVYAEVYSERRNQKGENESGSG